MGSVKKLVVGLCLITCTFSTVQSQEGIPWQPQFSLSWKNFTGTIPKGLTASATTASGISYDFSTFYEGNELKIDFRVSAYFYPNLSWYKPELCNDKTLLHEQLHFDITELFRRKMSKKLTTTKFTKKVKEEVRQIYKVTLRQLNDFQNKYDSETNYSRNLVVQERWVKEIEAALNQ